MLDYDAEAGNYDDTRGGEARAAAAAEAVERLLPAGAYDVVTDEEAKAIGKAMLR